MGDGYGYDGPDVVFKRGPLQYYTAVLWVWCDCLWVRYDMACTLPHSYRPSPVNVAPLHRAETVLTQESAHAPPQ